MFTTNADDFLGCCSNSSVKVIFTSDKFLLKTLPLSYLRLPQKTLPCKNVLLNFHNSHKKTVRKERVITSIVHVKLSSFGSFKLRNRLFLGKNYTDVLLVFLCIIPVVQWHKHTYASSKFFFSACSTSTRKKRVSKWYVLEWKYSGINWIFTVIYLGKVVRRRKQERRQFPPISLLLLEMRKMWEKVCVRTRENVSPAVCQCRLSFFL